MVVIAAALVLFGVWVVIAARGAAGDWAAAALRALRALSQPAQQEWVDAMLAEHGSIEDQSARRRFARGCLGPVVVSLVKPGRASIPVGGFFAACAGGTLGLGVFGLVHYPGLRTGWLWAVYFGVFVVLIAAYSTAGAGISRLGSTSARWAGVLAGTPAALCGWWAAASSSPLSSLAIVLMALPMAVAADYVARRQGANRALVAVACGSLTAGFLAFVGFITTTYATGNGPVTPVLLKEFAASGVPDYRSWVIGDNLGGGVFLLLFVPFLAMVLGLLARHFASRDRVAQ